VVKHVLNICKEAHININDNDIDRAHRIGKTYLNNTTQKQCKSIIVKFLTFRKRTLLYRERKKLKGVRVRIDLTSSRHKLLVNSNKFIKDNNLSDVKFTYADINCRLKIKWADENKNDNFFESFEEFKSLVC